MAETRLSKVLIKQQKLDEQGNPVFDQQGNPVYVYTEAPFAADIDDFMVYTDTATAYSVKDLVFGKNKDGTPVQPTDFAQESMWVQLKTQADACQKTLTDNASFWDGLSKAEYKEPENGNGDYLASGDEINEIQFYGDSPIGDKEEKLVSLGALDRFAKQITTFGESDRIKIGKDASVNDLRQVAIGPGAVCNRDGGGVAIGSYNNNRDAQFAVGNGISNSNRSTLFYVQDNILHLPKGVVQTDNNRELVNGEGVPWYKSVKLEAELNDLISISHPIEIVLRFRGIGVNDDKLGNNAVDNEFTLSATFQWGVKDTFSYKSKIKQLSYINFQIDYDGNKTFKITDSSYGRRDKDATQDYCLLKWELVSHQVSGINLF